MVKGPELKSVGAGSGEYASWTLSSKVDWAEALASEKGSGVCKDWKKEQAI